MREIHAGWPRKANLQDESGKPVKVDAWVTAATALIYGLVITTGTAWLVQFHWKLPACPPSSAEADRIADHATYWAFGHRRGLRNNSIPRDEDMDQSYR